MTTGSSESRQRLAAMIAKAVEAQGQVDAEAVRVAVEEVVREGGGAAAALLAAVEEVMGEGGGPIDHEQVARRLERLVGASTGITPSQASALVLRAQIRADAAAVIAQAMRDHGLTPAADLDDAARAEPADDEPPADADDVDERDGRDDPQTFAGLGAPESLGALDEALDQAIAAGRADAPPDKEPFDLPTVDALVDPDGNLLPFLPAPLRARTFAYQYYVAWPDVVTLAELARRLARM